MAQSRKEPFAGEIQTSHPKEEAGSNGELPPRDPGRSEGPAAGVPSRGERDRLGGSGVPVSGFKLRKLEEEAQKNWDLFYKRNTTNFFKDRHWTTREFQELEACREFEAQRLVLLEAGCGVGNCLFPLLEDDLNVFVYACDFSPRAVDFVKSNPLYSPERCCAFQCDLTRDDLRAQVPEGGVDVVTLIFVLSAIHPDKMQLALHNISRVLKPGGCVLFRDYGLNDHAMLRFKAGSKLGENFYVRQDGTRSYFFSKELLAELFADAGLQALSNEYVLRETVNKKEGLRVPRVFLQSKFTKPGHPMGS
ncbi:tRNA N(3)-methylcytidine methyltransferase METTL6 [Pungitius pungitius]|uniref:tRNA N(3)-methylcytidine methyltransferase METTL6 n=1 Tax=Pungitius pungitius TaxID=134920 RepID=UPI002E0F7C38